MGATQTDQESAPRKWGLIAVFILGVVLLIAAIWSLSRALGNSSPYGAAVPTNAAATMDAALSQDAIEMQNILEQRAIPTTPKPAVTQPVVAPTKQREDEIKLQQAKSKVNQRIVARMQQYVRDNPNRDNRELEEQIKKRENRGAPIQ
ncbi:MAG: hypothetical protein NT011_08500 [Kiritimatiellaeota bacterium]|nr:hypothetical protein [Kiritimatiellota bacterium]